MAWKKRVPTGVPADAPMSTRPSAAAVAEPEPVEEVVELTHELDADGAELESLGLELVRAARDKGRRNEALANIEKWLESLNDADMRALADHPVVSKFLDFRAKSAAKPTDPPGTIYYFRGIPFSKKPWTEADLRKSDIPMVTFTLDEPVPFVQWNGLRRSYHADVQYTDYACFYDLIRGQRQAKRFTDDHAAFLFEGKAATHRDMVDPASMKVRATATGGGERVVGGTMDGIAIAEAESGEG